MKKSKLIYAGVASLFIGSAVFAQQNNSPVADTTKKVAKVSGPLSKEGFKMNFNEEGTHYAKLEFTSQLWLMDNQNNPGSTVNGVPTANSYNVGLRRTRITILSQLTDKVFIFGQIGSDGISPLANGRSLPLQMLDVTLEYKLLGKYLTMGGGLSGWDGLSRYSNPSVPKCLGLDMPLYQQATVNITDNTVRMPGIYAKGLIGKLDYRVAVDIPYPTTTNTVIAQVETIATATVNPQFNASTFAGNKVKPQIQGYFKYQFFETESNLSPGTVGSYLGTKKVLNIGAGFRFQQNAMWQANYNQPATASTATVSIKDTARTNMLLWSIDLFYDTPLNKDKGTALTFYAAYSNYGFGKNYLRNSNPLNPATGTTANPATGAGTSTARGGFNPNASSFSGSGNQFAMIGSGSIYFAQAGYLMPKFKNGTQFQPYGMLTYANYQALKDPMLLWDLGINYLVKGHHSKFSLDYQSRPVYNLSTTDYQIHEVKSARRGMIVLQYQISF